jgi:DOPA 4,5-dioxygenase
MSEITSYHAHVYFDASTIEQARELCVRCRDLFGVVMGRVHERPVGPHPDWSCQLAFGPEKFAEVVPWLALNRRGLVVFTHPETGRPLEDHRDHAIWMGAVRPLDLSVFDTGT